MVTKPPTLTTLAGLAAIGALMSGCGDAEPARTDTTAMTASTVNGGATDPPVAFTGNRVPEQPWWQVESDPPPQPPPPPDPQTFEISSDLLFEVSSSELGPAASTQLRHLAGRLGGDPGATVEIIGHTDNTPGPTPDYNETLSHDRAAAVRQWLVDNGVDADGITTEGRADREPVATNDTEDGRASNRRVTITIQWNP